MNDKANESPVSALVRHAMTVLSLIFLAVPVVFFVGVPAEAASREQCVARYQKKAKCQVATYIINDTCKCKYDTNCRYPNSKAIECILDNIGEVRDNSAAYLMRNSCIQRSLLSGQ